jgi:hypothetical protein
VFLDHLPRRAARDDLAALHDDQPVAELRRFLHVVGRQHERLPLGRELAQAIPNEVARLGIQARRGLVEDDDLGIVDERARDEEPPLHPARELLDRRIGLLGELHKLQELPGPLLGDLARQVEVAPVHEEVLQDLEVVVQIVLLGDDPDAALDLALVLRDLEPRDRELPAGRDGRAVEHLHRGGLAGAVGPEETEALAPVDLKVHALYGLEVPVTFLETARDEGRLARPAPRAPLCLGVQAWNTPNSSLSAAMPLPAPRASPKPSPDALGSRSR